MIATSEGVSAYGVFVNEDLWVRLKVDKASKDLAKDDENKVQKADEDKDLRELVEREDLIKHKAKAKLEKEK